MLRLKPLQDIVLVQSADPVNYFTMLRSTSKLNRAFCIQHDVRYLCLHGVLRGYHPWHACYNRIITLKEMLDTGYKGWYLHLDSDAYVFDIHYDLRSYLAGAAEHSFIFTHGATKALWDVNDGVFFANCAHPHTRIVAERWLAMLKGIKPEKLLKAEKWYQTPCDQQMLHTVLRNDPELAGSLRHEHPRFMNGPGSSFVRQILRSFERDPELRLAKIQLEVERALQRQKLASDDVTSVYYGVARALDLPIPKDLAEVQAATADRAGLLDFLERSVAEARAAMAAAPPATAPAPAAAPEPAVAAPVAPPAAG
ncbi:hypothetical protein BKE38_13845 [Pseudoroseomonas deserti]|uniref:Nucleotide-diphospho-sugar transferase domain-containing protein n=1 Tax=Teichococcus deserti TaxID=1817963 RepID=A0A1V2H2I9_9PROT|nr:hypothetical protein [Pseudoroseomonas deserti]ONG52849.1 hypothetical protein BKE38_13845 [Pseudoroseomonas deserti]